MKLIDFKAIAVASILCLIPILGAVAIWGILPDTIAVSYDSELNPTRWIAKPLAVVGFPMAMCTLSIVLGFLGIWREERGEGSMLLYVAIWISPMLSISLSAYFMIGSVIENAQLNAFGFLALGVVLFAAGYTLIRLRTNTKFGIRTPWSVQTRENWERTNRIGGFCFMLAGIVFTIIGVSVMLRNMESQAATIALLSTAFVAVFIPFLFSYLMRSAK